MSVTKLALFLALSLSSAFAQFAQPVKDVEKEARSAVWGFCQPVVPTGQTSTVNGDNCTMGNLNGVIHNNATVPAGKILVIEEASASCGKANQNAFVSVQLHPANGLGRRIFDMSLQGTENLKGYYYGTTNGRMYVKGTNVRANLVLADAAVQNTSCAIYFYGHLVDVQ